PGTPSGSASTTGRARAAGRRSSSISRTPTWSGSSSTPPSSAPTSTPPAPKKKRRHRRANGASAGAEPGGLLDQGPHRSQRFGAAGDLPRLGGPAGGRQLRRGAVAGGAGRGRGRGGDSGQGLRQQGGGRRGRGPRGGGRDPDAEEPQGAAGHRRGALQGPQPGGTLLGQGQAVPPRGDALREDRPQLPGLRPRGRPHGPAAMTFTVRPRPI